MQFKHEMNSNLERE